ncbi:MAG: hypothetical protein N4A45_10500 [Flavobacteriales bacterium]|jgi:hypothetical protein|nr:hypothetical protein [Flavobacteriales bacterium]
MEFTQRLKQYETDFIETSIIISKTEAEFKMKSQEWKSSDEAEGVQYKLEYLRDFASHLESAIIELKSFLHNN